MKINWECKTYPIKSLKPQDKNARKMTKDQKRMLEQSINNYGFAEPIVINKDMTIIGGHQRYYILKSLGCKAVECMEPDVMLDDLQVDELTIRLNKNQGDFDYDLLANNYDVENLLDWGFNMDELHLESVPDQEEEPKTCRLTVTFYKESELLAAEDDIKAIAYKHNGTCRIRIK